MGAAVAAAAYLAVDVVVGRDAHDIRAQLSEADRQLVHHDAEAADRRPLAQLGRCEDDGRDGVRPEDAARERGDGALAQQQLAVLGGRRRRVGAQRGAACRPARGHPTQRLDDHRREPRVRVADVGGDGDGSRVLRDDVLDGEEERRARHDGRHLAVDAVPRRVRPPRRGGAVRTDTTGGTDAATVHGAVQRGQRRRLEVRGLHALRQRGRRVGAQGPVRHEHAQRSVHELGGLFEGLERGGAGGTGAVAAVDDGSQQRKDEVVADVLHDLVVIERLACVRTERGGGGV